VFKDKFCVLPWAVTSRATPTRKSITVNWFRLNKHRIFITIEKQVLVPSWKGEPFTGIKAERCCRKACIWWIGTAPHWWIDYDKMWVGIVNGWNRIWPRRGTKMEDWWISTKKQVAVIRTATAVIYAQRVVNWNVATKFATNSWLRRWYIYNNGDIEKEEEESHGVIT
jgi:hypothetical protein